MKKWEYKIIDNALGVNPDDTVGLNYLGEEGWELVAVRKSDCEYGGWKFYFKREVEVKPPVGGWA